MTISTQARRNRLVLVVVGVGLVAVLLVLARGALFPFILSGILAYILYPIVSAVESVMPWRERRPDLSRILAIWLVFLLALAILAGALALTVPPALREGNEFLNEVPDYYARARTAIEDWNQEYADRIPEDVRASIEEYAASGGSVLIGVARSVLAKTVGAVTNVLSTIIGLVVVPFMLFYLLKDREAAIEGIYSLLPPEARRHAVNVVEIVNRVLGAYIRAQLTLGVVVGVVASLGLFLLGIKFSVLLGLVAGVTELIPIIGPLLGAIPGVFVALATSPDKVIWVVLLYAGIQTVENTVLVPRIQSHAVGVHPAIVMVALMVGSETAGLWGVLLSVPVTAVGRDVFTYFHAEWSERDTPLESEPVVEADEAGATEPEQDGSPEDGVEETTEETP